jgi:hypothetical protein
VIEEAPHEICRMRFGCQPEQRLRVREVRWSTSSLPHEYVRIQRDLGVPERRPTSSLPNFLRPLLPLLPGLERNGCKYGEPGGSTPLDGAASGIRIVTPKLGITGRQDSGCFGGKIREA